MSRRGWLSPLFISLAFHAVGAANESTPEKRTFTNAGSESLPYRLVRPLAEKPGEKHPLVVALHGAGQRGTDNEAQINEIVRAYLRPEVREKHPHFLIAPQCPPEPKWTGVNWQQKPHAPQTPEPTSSLRLVLELIEHARKELPIDSARIYITGISMGGSGSWDAITRRPDLFAAAVIICGGADEAQGHKLAKLPVWCFQGAKDDMVTPELSRNMIAAIKAAGGAPRYTELPDAGHNIGTQVYRDPAVIDWLFGQKR